MALVFWCPEGFSSNANNHKQGLGNPDTFIFDHNVFYGSPGPKEDAHRINLDPKFLDPGTGGDGFETLKGYYIRPDSTCIRSGLALPDNGGRDFFGNCLPNGRLDIGAQQFNGADN